MPCSPAGMAGNRRKDQESVKNLRMQRNIKKNQRKVGVKKNKK